MSIAAYTGKTLILRQPSAFKQYFELFHEEQVIGKFEMPRHIRHDAYIELPGSKWEIRKTSFWKSRYGIFKPGNEMPSAEYIAKALGDGILELPKGIKWTFTFRMWKAITEIRDENGQLVLTSDGKAGFKEHQTINIFQNSQILEENPYIILLSGFMSVIRRRHST